MIRITSKQHNFRRCRVAHPKGTTEYPDGTFTPEQLKVLQAEPKLTVEIVPAVAEAIRPRAHGREAMADTEESSAAEASEDGEQIEGTEDSSSAEAPEDKERPDPGLEELTVPELIARCEARGIEVPKKARKAELIALLS